MWAFLKAVVRVHRTLVRIAQALERANELAELDLRERGVIEVKAGVKDEAELLYGVKAPAEDSEQW